MAKLVDTNLIIRFLIKDNPKQFEAAEKIFISQEDLILPDVIFAETVWTLKSVYKVSKQETVEKLVQLLQFRNIQSNYYLLMDSLLVYQGNNFSYVDAYLIASSQLGKLEGIYSFDEGLDKVKSIKRFKP